MKRSYISTLLLVTLVASSCTQDDALMEHDGTPMSNNPMFTASFENTDSRTYIEEINDNLYLRWTSNDELSIFMGTTLNQHYRFTGETGDNSGGFEQASSPGFVTGNALDNPCHYAYYPYNGQTKIKENGVMTVVLPTEQSYAKNSFGVGANAMIAVTKDLNDMQLSFKNVGGYFKFKFYGDDITLKSISLKGNQDEKIAGPATLTASHTGLPTINMNSDATGTITLNCGDGIKIGQTKEDATEFWLVLPPTKFEQGFTLTLTDVDGNEFIKSTTKAFEIKRNTIKPISAIEVEIEKIPTYHVATAGTLSSLIPEEEKYAITEMKVTGYLNGDDIRLIRAMLGRNLNNDYEDNNTNNETGGLLTILDLSEATIKSGGEYYIDHFGEKYYTQDYVLGKHIFNRCNNLKQISLPKNLLKIEDCAFAGCVSLTDVTFYDGLTSIEGSMYGGAFLGCTNLKNINLPSSLEEIGYGAFMNCIMLENIIIPEKVKNIGNRAFGFCESLVSVNIPNGIESISESLFIGCESLSTISIPTSVTTILGRAFSDCLNILELKIPDSVSSIGDYATFQNCQKLNSIVLSNNITTIPASAFGNCYSLFSITIPAKVGFIEEWAFSSCPLKEIHCLGIIPPTIEDETVFYWDETDLSYSRYSDCVLYVPKGSLSAYQSAKYWKNFTNIIEE